MPTIDGKQNMQNGIVGLSDSAPITNGINCDKSRADGSSSDNVRLPSSEDNDFGATNSYDGNTTLLSDSSTLHGDSTNIIYVNKCAELERTVESLKEKLISKEKELTEFQLKQWSSDYLIGQLKSSISKLEKENAQLRSVVGRYNKVNLN